MLHAYNAQLPLRYYNVRRRFDAAVDTLAFQIANSFQKYLIERNYNIRQRLLDIRFFLNHDTKKSCYDDDGKNLLFRASPSAIVIDDDETTTTPPTTHLQRSSSSSNVNTSFDLTGESD